MSNLIKDFYMYGTQYYRAPTPLPDEWEIDLKNMDKAGLDTIQLRVQWRKNEPREDEYFFEDIDELFDLAEKYGKKVIFKFLMENAPDYLYDKYDAMRRDMHGLPIMQGSTGAYYIGGWLPCFDNPDVIRRAELFAKVFTERYKNRPNLVLWNIWNEPLSRPVGECGCPASLRTYRQWLRERFGTIEQLNEQFGKGWGSFDSITAPGMIKDYADFYLWQTWCMQAVRNRLDFMYRVVKGIDPERPVMTHIGGSSVLQDVVHGGSDDILNSEAVDFYGTSFPTAKQFKNILDDAYPCLNCDWLRHIDKNYYVHELYPDFGRWNPTEDAETHRFKVYTAIAHGTKGVVYWQYRAERLGNENNLAGLVNIDGSFKTATREAKKIGDFIRANEAFLIKSEAVADPVGILYSFASDLISRIENSGNSMYDFGLIQGPGHLYAFKRSLHGIYALLREMKYAPQLVDSRRLKETLPRLKVLYIPQAYILPDDAVDAILDFAAKGGQVIAEEGIGLRRSNTWLNYPWPGRRWREFFGLKVAERVSTAIRGDTMSVFGQEIAGAEYCSYLEDVDGDAVVGKWSDGRPAVVQRADGCYIATAFGAAFYDDFENKAKYMEIMQKILQPSGLTAEYGGLPDLVYARALELDERRLVFVFNRSDKKKTVSVKGREIIIQPHDVNWTITA